MVTVLMAILIFLGIGWQFAFEQWGTQKTISSNLSLSVSLPISVTKILIGVTSNCDNINAVSSSFGVCTGSSFLVHTWYGSNYANDMVAYVVICI